MNGNNEVPVTNDTQVNPPTPPIVDAPKVDMEAIKASVAEELRPELLREATEGAKKAVVESIVGKPEPSKWHPQDYEEIKETTKKETIEAFKDLQKQEAEASEKAKKAQDELNTKSREELDKYWNDQLTDMEKAGKLPSLPPEITKKLAEGTVLTNEEKDIPGLIARGELYAKAHELKDKGFRDFNNLELVWYKMQEDKEKLPAGANAPVLFAHKGITPTTGSDYTYEEIHGARSVAEVAKQS